MPGMPGRTGSPSRPAPLTPRKGRPGIRRRVAAWFRTKEEGTVATATLGLNYLSRYRLGFVKTAAWYGKAVGVRAGFNVAAVEREPVHDCGRIAGVSERLCPPGKRLART